MSGRHIGHNRNLNKLRAVLVAICAIFPLVIAIQMASFLSAREFYLVYIPGGIGLVILLWAGWTWARPPRSRAMIEFHDDGFFVEVNSFFRGFEHDVLWSDLREIRDVKGGYGVRNLDVMLTHEASERLGLVQPTTRKTSSDLLVGRRLSIPTSLLELSGKDIIAAMTEAADRAGYVIERSGRREYLVLSEVRYSVKPKG